MKKKYVFKKKAIIVLLMGVVLIGGIIILITNMNRDKKITENNIASIKSSYSLLSNKITEYNETREEYTKITDNLLLDDFKNKRDNILTLLDKYNAIIDDIDEYIDDIKSKCGSKYSDDEAYKICNNYGRLYEKLVNLYVSDLKKYNAMVTKYNEYSDSDISLYEMIHTDYIDFDNNSIYEGRDSSEEN